MQKQCTLFTCVSLVRRMDKERARASGADWHTLAGRTQPCAGNEQVGGSRAAGLCEDSLLWSTFRSSSTYGSPRSRDAAQVSVSASRSVSLKCSDESEPSRVESSRVRAESFEADSVVMLS